MTFLTIRKSPLLGTHMIVISKLLVIGMIVIAIMIPEKLTRVLLLPIVI
jgi:hypothetical protein